jgi:phage tail sheath protein FI
MPNLGPFKHGVSWSDVPTSVISPVPAYPGINVVFGTAPLHLSVDGKGKANTPRIYNRYEDAVAELGYSKDWSKYDLCEHMDAVFVEFGVFPVVYIAVNDPDKNAIVVAPAPFTLVNGQVNTAKEFIAWTVLVESTTLRSGGKKAGAEASANDPDPAPKVAGTDYVLGVDYLLSYDSANHAIITRIPGGAITSDSASVTISGKTPAVTAITAADIIGGIDAQTGKRTGLEVIEDVFQATARVPGVIICPKWSHDPTVAAAMLAKSENINGCFACTCLIDVDTSATASPPVHKASDVNAWKNTNNIVFPRQQCLFGNPSLVAGDGTKKQFHFASQQGPLMQWVDTYRGGGLPFHSPSNKNLRMNSLQLADGSELPMHLLDANALNSQGIVTALNWIGGWRSWGNRTAAYPANSDVKDMFIPVRRTFDFIGNTIVLTIWQKVDEPGNRRLIDAIVNSLQQWLDGLTNEEALVGARIEFRHDENPTTEILNGHYTFHILIAVPTPAEWLDFRIEYYVPFISNLWPEVEAAAA